MTSVLWAMGSVTLVSLVSLAGLATLGWNPVRVRRVALTFIAFAVGALLGDTFIHLLPEAFQGAREPLAPSLLVMVGFSMFFVLEKVLRRRTRHLHARTGNQTAVAPIVGINLVGDGLHNFIDGALVAASYGVSFELGVSTTFAVLLHELPQEIGDFGVLVHGGLTVRRAVLFNLLSGAVALVGAAVTLLAGARVSSLSAVLVPVTAGGFLYLAAADLVPELHQQPPTLRNSLTQVALIGAGVAVMVVLTLVE